MKSFPSLPARKSGFQTRLPDGQEFTTHFLIYTDVKGSVQRMILV